MVAKEHNRAPKVGNFTALPKLSPARGQPLAPVTARTHRDTAGHKPSGFLSSRAHYSTTTNKDLHSVVDRALEEFGSGSTPIEEVKAILADVRRQYDEVHAEAERKERELEQLRDKIRSTDDVSQVDVDDVFRMEAGRKKLEDRLAEVYAQIEEAKMTKKVYEHMLTRINNEFLHMREQMLKMDKLLKRRKAEFKGKSAMARRASEQRQTASKEYEKALAELEEARTARENALEEMMGSLQSAEDSIRRRAEIENWRRGVAVEAANEAFNATAGRLRKLWVMEKLTGNCLQKAMVEQVQRSQATEDGFQKIREVTGLNDVMDIVHRFLNREIEQEQLRQFVAEAEVELEEVKEENARLCKEVADANLFVPDSLGKQLPDPLTNEERSLYMELDERERELVEATQAYNTSRERLQKARIDAEIVRRWAERTNKSLGAFEQPMELSRPHCYQTLAKYFDRLPKTIQAFCEHVKKEYEAGHIKVKSLTEAQSRAKREQNKLLDDKEFGRVNCRVRPGTDPECNGRKRETAKVSTDDDDVEDPRFTAERAELKASSTSKIEEAEKQLKNPSKRKSRRNI